MVDYREMLEGFGCKTTYDGADRIAKVCVAGDCYGVGARDAIDPNELFCRLYQHLVKVGLVENGQA